MKRERDYLDEERPGEAKMTEREGREIHEGSGKGVGR
jgi:hypothetical protein